MTLRRGPSILASRPAHISSNWPLGTQGHKLLIDADTHFKKHAFKGKLAQSTLLVITKCKPANAVFLPALPLNVPVKFTGNVNVIHEALNVERQV